MSRALALLLAVLWLPMAAHAEDETSDAKSSVRVLPARPIEPGAAVTIDGIAPLDAQGAVAVRIQPPNNAPQIKLDVKPSGNGDYSVTFKGTSSPGTYGVGVSSPGGKAVGSQSGVSGNDGSNILAMVRAPSGSMPKTPHCRLPRIAPRRC